MEISDIPIEVLLYIFLQEDRASLVRCRRVCVQWRNIIDNSDYLWENLCCKDFPHTSKIAKEKSNNECTWFHIYRNMWKWSYNRSTRSNLEFLELDLPIIDFIENLSAIPLNCRASNNKWLTFANNDYALVLFYKLALVVVRPVDNEDFQSEKCMQAAGFSLCGDKLYYFFEKQVFICDLVSPTLSSTCILNTCDCDIKAIRHFDGKTHIFTDDGKIITILNGNKTVKTIHCPPVFIGQIKYISAIDEKNYICYSRNMFNIVTERNVNLYLESNEITALFYYGHFVAMAERTGSILVYHMNELKFTAYERMLELRLPTGHYALHLDIYERKAGPVIIATTLSKIFMLEIDFFPEEKDGKLPLPIQRLKMYKRVLDDRNIISV